MANKKNGGNIPPVTDERVLYVPVGCGKCMECKRKKATQWKIRLQEDIKLNKNGKFVTYTFSDEKLQELDNLIDKSIQGYERDNEITRIAVRRYTERWRKKYKKALRHWLVTEIGGKATERVHIHGIVWSQNEEDIRKIWQYGEVHIGTFVNNKTVNYIVKYLNKVDQKHPNYVSKMFASKGIGKNYLNRSDKDNNKYIPNKTIETYTTREGTKLNLPIYYRNYIYTEEEREKLWLEKLDKQIRWVNGQKIDISNGDEDYYKILETERLRNERLGYGDNTINWSQRNYERQQRALKKKERIQRIWNKKNK